MYFPVSRFNMPINIFQLPVEVVHHILLHTHPLEIVQIWHSIPELRYLITSDILLIVTNNSLPQSKYNLPKRFFCTEKAVNKDNILHGFNGVLLLELGAGESTLAQVDFGILAKGHYPTHLILNRFDRWHETASFLEDHNYNNHHIRSISVPCIENFRLPTFKMNKDVFQFPNVKKVKVNGTNSNDLNIEATRSMFPRVESLEFSGKIELMDFFVDIELPRNFTMSHIMPSTVGHTLEYHLPYSSKLEYLEINGCFETARTRSFSILDLSLPNIKRIHILDSVLSSMKRLSMPKLKTLLVERSIINEISHLRVPLLQSLSLRIDNWNKFIFMDIIAPRLREFDFDMLNSKMDLRISKFHFPLLQAATIGFSDEYEGHHNNALIKTFNFLNNLNALTLGNCLHLIDGLSFQSLTTLVIQNEKSNGPHKISRLTQFPRLNELIIYGQELKQKNEVLLLNSSRLQTLVLENIPNFSDISILPIDFISILNLSLINNAALSSIQGIRYRFLKKLDIKTLSNSNTPFDVSKCNFESLESLSIESEGEVRFVEVKAPSLVELEILSSYIVNSFSTKDYPQLRKLTIGKLNDLHIEPSDLITEIDLSANNFIKELVMDQNQLPNLKVFKDFTRYNEPTPDSGFDPVHYLPDFGQYYEDIPPFETLL
ncbi:hypothetical protein BN7_6259 [Wickerhamomyces ciferrii]|uniref:Internalin-I n=1 Tax=Wickerhamomyces ciferrii (strain ATCC 14091 / BCRC 22168 / CBS 111 / JCM 3599 / NBRC 0793 / NRRL Y-1031 F-60-10) TaxID=1206466 RepID=K0KZT2_WICCF|nr:uncharacterized protein BN7_6259 [Wickerhamomyces ciferrii]CCH46663.1 hypothetical protein BN7_6259 [Wickerhamomyces ciferrii]